MIGDIVLNKWASEENPSRITIIVSHNNKSATGIFPFNGKVERVSYYLDDLKKDKEHFVKIGSVNLAEVCQKIINKLDWSD